MPLRPYDSSARRGASMALHSDILQQWDQGSQLACLEQPVPRLSLKGASQHPGTAPAAHPCSNLLQQVEPMGCGVGRRLHVGQMGLQHTCVDAFVHMYRRNADVLEAVDRPLGLCVDRRGCALTDVRGELISSPSTRRRRAAYERDALLIGGEPIPRTTSDLL